MAKTMKAMQTKSYGPDAKLELVDLPIGTPKESQILVEIKASGVNPVDWKLLSTNFGINPELPAVLGCDVAGVVKAVGPGVTKFKVGDEVYGFPGGFQNNPGCFAEYIVADVRSMALKPKKLDFRQAAALPLVCCTAWEALIDKALLKSGDYVLIHSATGGVGHVAIQIAKAKGAKVATTISNDEKAKIAKRLGADTIINYKQKTVEQYVKECCGDANGFDIVFDTVGGEHIDKCMFAVKDRGHLVTVQAVESHDLTPAFFRGLSLHIESVYIPMIKNLKREKQGEILEECAKLVDAGKLTPLLDEKVFKFTQANEGLEYQKSGKAVGKVVFNH